MRQIRAAYDQHIPVDTAPAMASQGLNSLLILVAHDKGNEGKIPRATWRKGSEFRVNALAGVP